MSRTREHQFSSRLGLLLSVLGIAVGTGNIWRFPRIAAQNGGNEGAGAFLISWIIFLFIWSIPLIIAEYALGRKGRMGVVGSFVRSAGERFAWAGAFVGLVATCIMFYYSVVTGWCFYYFIAVATSALPQSTEASQALWTGFQDGWGPLGFHALAVGMGAVVILRGVRSIERVSFVLIPALFVIILVSLVRTLTLEGAADGIAFLFTPQWNLLLKPQTWLEALTQNAWDTGAGWGLILTYGAYMQPKHGIVKNAFMTGIGNNTVSILAAVILFGTVFAVLGAEMPKEDVLGVMRDSGPASTGLTFIWMPLLFARMPFGAFLAALFFLGLSFAAFTSLISMIELAVRVVVDLGAPRWKAVIGVATGGFVLGMPSAMDLNVLGNQDFVWGVALMLSGALVAFAVIRNGVGRFRKEVVNKAKGDWHAGILWEVLIRWAVPLQALILMIWWLYLSATVYAPTTWYDPLDPYSVMTCLVQWGLALLAVLLLNRWLVAGMRRAHTL